MVSSANLHGFPSAISSIRSSAEVLSFSLPVQQPTHLLHAWIWKIINVKKIHLPSLEYLPLRLFLDDSELLICFVIAFHQL